MKRADEMSTTSVMITLLTAMIMLSESVDSQNILKALTVNTRKS